MQQLTKKYFCKDKQQKVIQKSLNISLQILTNISSHYNINSRQINQYRYQLMSEPANVSVNEKPEATEKEFEYLLEIIKINQQQRIRQFLESHNPSVLTRLQLGFRQPALYFAVTSLNDHTASQMVKLLISYGANPKYKDQNDQTILFYACRDGKLQCCKTLIQNGLDIEEQDMYGQTPLFYAASENRLNLLQLFENKEIINHVDKLASQTALYYAARKGHTQMCKRLIEKGANPAHLDSQNKTAAEYAKKARHNDTAEYINQQIKRQTQVLMPQSAQMSAQLQQSQQLDKKNKKPSAPSSSPSVPRATYKIVFMNQKGEAKDLTEEQVRNLIKNNPTLQTYLSNPNSIPVEQLQKMQSTQSWEKLASKLLQTVMKQKGAYWFLEPVDPVKFNIMDYFDIIQKPMDLGTIKKKLSHNVYQNVQHFVDDMNLIWENTCKYNGEQHDISRTARELQVFFNEEFKKIGLDQWKQE